ncbi:MAG: polyphosphate polymerase domain-containing protein [Oscillospiraceae bacterium]|nr:polyphosphate polymerase domain-containing protein [Oscillospiraceae bacterium]
MAEGAEKFIASSAPAAAVQATFERYEKKYLMTAEQYRALRSRLDPLIRPDLYPESTVCSIYYDTDDFSIIRESIEKPVYKEKLRLRSYNVPGEEGEVFVELKKKFKGVVYKRRVAMTNRQAELWLSGEAPAPEDSQIIREISWFLKMNRPSPKVLICYDRLAYVAISDPRLRITFDRNMRWRDSDLHLPHGDGGAPIVDPGHVLMEVKIPGAAPVWLAKMLSELQIYPTSFSKYGSAYRGNILQKYFME